MLKNKAALSIASLILLALLAAGVQAGVPKLLVLENFGATW